MLMMIIIMTLLPLTARYSRLAENESKLMSREPSAEMVD